MKSPFTCWCDEKRDEARRLTMTRLARSQGNDALEEIFDMGIMEHNLRQFVRQADADRRWRA